MHVCTYVYIIFAIGFLQYVHNLATLCTSTGQLAPRYYFVLEMTMDYSLYGC